MACYVKLTATKEGATASDAVHVVYPLDHGTAYATRALAQEDDLDAWERLSIGQEVKQDLERKRAQVKNLNTTWRL